MNIKTPLIDALIQVNEKQHTVKHPDGQLIKVSRTVSFFAFWYEKMRNAVEYREDHLIRRAAVERILKRRLMLNNQGKRVAELLIKELLWARYLKENSIPENKIESTQNIIDKYIYLRNQIVPGRKSNEQSKLDKFIVEILSCEIEENLAPDFQRDAFTNFVYQSLVTQVELSDKKLNDDREIFLYIAVQLAYAKSDYALIRYHLVKILLPELIGDEVSKAGNALVNFMNVYLHIENSLQNKILIKLRQFVKRNTPPFLILRDLFQYYPKNIKDILQSEEELRYKVDEICRKKYQETRNKLNRAGVRSIIYIFLTKMLLALLLEYPVDLYFQSKVDYIPLAINSIVPPILMFLVVATTSIPDAENSKRIFEKLKTIIFPQDIEKTIIKTTSIIKRPILTFAFSILNVLAFILTFGSITYLLRSLNFNIASQLIFIFFASVVVFFGYRIRQTAKEYLLVERDGIFSPLSDYYMLPILSLGKWLSSEIARINIFIFIFDFIIEAPFKAFFEIGEEWISFMKKKKEEFT